MKKIFVLSTLFSITLFFACNKEEINDDIMQESSYPIDNTDNHDDNSTISFGKANFTINNESDILESDVLLLTNKSVNAVSYLWDFGNGDTSREAQPNYNYKIHGYYTVSLTITDIFGETHQASEEIEILCLFGGGIHESSD